MIKPILNMRAIYHTRLTGAYKWICSVGGTDIHCSPVVCRRFIAIRVCRAVLWCPGPVSYIPASSPLGGAAGGCPVMGRPKWRAAQAGRWASRQALTCRLWASSTPSRADELAVAAATAVRWSMVDVRLLACRRSAASDSGTGTYRW